MRKSVTLSITICLHELLNTFSHALNDVAICTFEPSLVLISNTFVELEHDCYVEDRIAIINLCRE